MGDLLDIIIQGIGFYKVKNFKCKLILCKFYPKIAKLKFLTDELITLLTFVTWRNRLSQSYLFTIIHLMINE